MKRTFVFGLLAILAFDVLAVTETNISVDAIAKQTPETSMAWTKDLSLTLETETSTVKDRSNDINGTQTFFLAEPAYKITKSLAVSTGIQYTMRQMNPEANQRNSDWERLNSDDLENAFVKLLYKPTKFSENGIADVRLQARAYSDQNDIFKRRYGSDGNYQFRAYFGRPIYGKFYINKYTSYLRYKKYILNKHNSDYTRDNELRARVSPTYKIMDGLDLGVTLTYNHYNMRGNTSAAGRNYSESVDVGPSIRYQVGSYAVLFWSDLPMLQTNESGSLGGNEKAGAEVTYALNFAAYL